MVPFYPLPFCPTVPFYPNMPCSILPPRLHLEKSHYVNCTIALCSIKCHGYAVKRYIIIFKHMQRVYYLICQSNWCQNASKLIYQKGQISFFWDTQNGFIASLISTCDAELADDRNQMDVKIDRQAFFKTPGVPFCPHVPFCPDLL